MRPGGPPNMQQLMKQAQKMQQQLMAAQEELAQAEVEGTAGGGMVKVIMDGQKNLKSLTIDREDRRNALNGDVLHGLLDALRTDARVVVLTADTDDSRVVAALRAGAVGYVRKDSEPEVFLAAVRAA